MRHTSRGQVLPLWVVAIMTTFVLMFMALNYGNVIRWQVRAQSAADAAAQALLSVQTQRWNMMTEMLYATNIEEYRARRLLDGILLSVNNSGGCAQASGGSTCAANYMSLRSAYLQSVNRYTKDINALNNVASSATRSAWQTDAGSLLSHMQNPLYCNPSNVAKSSINIVGVDCGFTYTVIGAQARTGLQDIVYDAQGICIPGLGRVCTTNQDTETADFAPLQIDVVACAVVPAAIPNFWMFHTQPYYAVGRAAATSVMFEEDWFEPGALYDSVRGP
ncbi:MAG TPA: pilus assembly protein TadG-related protein, partial [Candidatus Baltobacteraceae bacterium]|nr:pilus assembly protein TadG-related protein [Candidatus Baltobacteraceae bacterium]